MKKVRISPRLKASLRVKNVRGIKKVKKHPHTKIEGPYNISWVHDGINS